MGPPTLQPGDTLEGKYVIKDLLGEGGMGKVYEAVHLQIDKKVAVKRLNPEHAGNANNVERFLREAKAAATIGHHGIIDIYDIGVSDDGAPFLVMEYLVGQTLSSAIEERGMLDEPTTAYVACQSLSALAAAHDSGIVHRDLKPDNIFLVDVNRPLPEVKLLDFGISKMLANAAPSESLTLTGAVLGTPFYMSPEQAQGERMLDNRVDIWAMGVILYQCLTGKVPYTGRSYNEVLAKIIINQMVKPSHLVPSLTPALEQIIMKALARDRDQRYGSATELLVDLVPFVDERHAFNISISPELRNSMDAIVKVRESSAPTLLADSSERPPTMATNPPHAVSNATDAASGETVAAATGESITGEGPRDALAGPPPSRRSRWPIIAITVVAAFVLGALAVVLLGRDGREPDTNPGVDDARDQAGSAPVAQPTSPTNPAKNPTKSATVKISISIQPKQATIFFDDALLEDNPFTGQLPMDGRQHSIRAEAQGYETKTWTVTFTEDHELSAELVPKRSTKTKRLGTPRRPDDDPWAGQSKSAGSAQEDPWAD